MEDMLTKFREENLWPIFPVNDYENSRKYLEDKLCNTLEYD